MYGFSGNLWHNYLTFLLVNHENAFSMACEIKGPVSGSINCLAEQDFSLFKELYEFDLGRLDSIYGTRCCSVICNYENVDGNSKMFNSRIRDRICSMSRTLAEASSVGEFMDDMVGFYRDFGVGKLGLHKAFRIVHGKMGEVMIEPITRTAHVRLENLVGLSLIHI